MSFTYTIDSGDATGRALITGTYTNTSASTGGTIATGFNNIYHFSATSATSTPSVVATLSNGTATITTTANQTGTWMAIAN